MGVASTQGDAAIGVRYELIRLVVLNPKIIEPITTETLTGRLVSIAVPFPLCYAACPCNELASGQAATYLIFTSALISAMRSSNSFALGLYARNKLGWDRDDGIKIVPLRPDEEANEGGDAHGRHQLQSPCWR